MGEKVAEEEGFRQRINGLAKKPAKGGISRLPLGKKKNTGGRGHRVAGSNKVEAHHGKKMERHQIFAKKRLGSEIPTERCS